MLVAGKPQQPCFSFPSVLGIISGAQKILHVLEYLGVTGHQVQLALKVQEKTNDNGCINIEQQAMGQMQQNINSWGT